LVNSSPGGGNYLAPVEKAQFLSVKARYQPCVEFIKTSESPASRSAE
jgi:hypothetical protein